MLSRAGQSPESQLSAFLRGRSLMAIFEIVKLIFAFNYPAHAHVTRSLGRTEEDTDEGGPRCASIIQMWSQCILLSQRVFVQNVKLW